jgi:hypothetical protein
MLIWGIIDNLRGISSLEATTLQLHIRLRDRQWREWARLRKESELWIFQIFWRSEGWSREERDFKAQVRDQLNAEIGWNLREKRQTEREWRRAEKEEVTCAQAEGSIEYAQSIQSELNVRRPRIPLCMIPITNQAFPSTFNKLILNAQSINKDQPKSAGFLSLINYYLCLIVEHLDHFILLRVLMRVIIYKPTSWISNLAST